MTKRSLLWLFAILVAATSAHAQKPKGGYIIQKDAEIAKNEPGTHNGGGQTVGYSFFDKTPGMKFVFRKRALKPGSGIGYHEQKEDEVYYVLSGTRCDDAGRQAGGHRSRHRDPDQARQLARPEAGRQRGSGDPDRLRDQIDGGPISQ